jgi:hypothetical protein
LETLTVTPTEAALRQLAGVMVATGTKHAVIEFSFGTLVAEIRATPDDSPTVGVPCSCGHDLESEHNGGGCLLGCDESRCDGRAAAVSQLEREVFGRIFAGRNK